MRIEGFDVTYLSSYDGLPVKNHLPVDLSWNLVLKCLRNVIGSGISI